MTLANLKKQLKGLKDLLIQMLPINRVELCLFILFCVLYGCLAIFIATQTNLLDKARCVGDTFLGFDAQYIMNNGVVMIRNHPFMQGITIPLIYIGLFFEHFLDPNKGRTVFLIAMSTILTTLNLIFVFRYLNSFLELKKQTSVILITFYFFFGMNFILSFTFESFVFSLFLLPFCIYYYSHNIKEAKPVHFLSSLFLAMSMGGITITNIAKGVIPILFLDNSLSKKIKRIISISFVFGVCAIFVLFFDKTNLEDYIGNINQYQANKDSVIEYIISFFWGAPILLPQFIQGFLPVEDPTWTCPCISPVLYSHIWQYASVIIIALLCLLAIAKNYKEKLIYIPVLFFACDLFIHVIMRYGINEGIIYGGHWIFIVPILIGWLYKKVEGKQAIALNIILVGLTLVIACNNIYRLKEFVDIALEIYPN